ncbi:MAG TPA: hypothetical protein VD927_16700 [Chryseosolibacter sp.]|nr:hypothetical protein [Chryseosolibacter sp.]
MTPFEYVIVLISIIIGLGITTILSGLAEIIKHRHSSRFYAPYLIWIVLVFVMHIHEWWESYSLRTIEEWKLPMFLFVILYPIALYILAHLLFPADIRNGFNSRDFFLSNYPRIFVTAITLVVLSIIHNVFVADYALMDQVIQFALLIILSGVMLLKIRNSLVHHVVAIVFLALMLGSLILLQDTYLTIR